MKLLTRLKPDPSGSQPDRERQNFLHIFYFFISHEQKKPGHQAGHGELDVIKIGKDKYSPDRISVSGLMNICGNYVVALLDCHKSTLIRCHKFK